MKTYSLLEINLLIADQLQQLSRQFWVVAEVAQATFQNHAYLELVQQEKGKIVAKSKAAIWAPTVQALRRKLGTSPENILKKGSKVLIFVEINFHEIYGLSLVISDVDLNFAIGEMEAKRQATLARLQKEELIYKQSELEIPLVVQKIVVISSAEAAGFGDFMHQISENSYGYRFSISLLESSVQGQKALSELVARLDSIGEQEFDAVVLIRGGGSKLDLAVFDEYELAKAVCLCKIPVLTGIGHQRDASVCDLVSAKSLKTPTAVAEFIIERAFAFEAEMLRLNELIYQRVVREINLSQKELHQVELSIKKGLDFYVRLQRKALPQHLADIEKSASIFIQSQKLKLKTIGLQIDAFSPEKNLSKGYSLTLQNGKILKHPPPKGEKIETVLAHGRFESVVI